MRALCTMLLAMSFFILGCDPFPPMTDDGSNDPHYNEQQFEELINQAPLVMVKFGAPWCGPCRLLDQELPNVTGSVEIVSINVDNNSELSSKYEVNGIPAIFLFRDGKKVASMVGYSTADELSEWAAKY